MWNMNLNICAMDLEFQNSFPIHFVLTLNMMNTLHKTELTT